MMGKETVEMVSSVDKEEKEPIEIDVSQPGHRLVFALEKGRVVREYILKISKKGKLILL